MSDLLRIAGCQFSIEADMAHNLDEVLWLVAQAAEQQARVVHFPEAALSGYAGVDLPDTHGIDWEQLREATRQVCEAAARHKVWVLLGSTHPLSGTNRPHNSLYVIDDCGRIVDRYDKRFCTGSEGSPPTFDLCHYTPGNHSSVFEVDGFCCGLLICYDYRFPELYRELKQCGVEVVFQSFHNARRDEQTHREANIWKEIVPATMMCRAATNHFWISATNSTARYSSWPSFAVRPDGRITGRLPEHQRGALITEVDRTLELWDAPGPWRERAMSGQLHSGQLVDDPRSDDRTCL